MISVVIPVYNGEAYIRRCLDSLLASEGDCIEIIAVNDGSRDASSAILHEYADRYPDRVIVVDKENGGASQARKTGVDMARGEYVGFVDADDYVAPDWYRRMEEKAQKTGADIVVCNYVEVYPTRQNPVKNRFKKGQSFPLTPAETMTYLHKREAYFPFPWNKIYRTELVRRVEFPTENFVGEDYKMHLQLLHDGAKVEFLDMEGYFYVLTESSVSRGGFGPGSLRTYRHFKEDYAWILANHPEEKKLATNYLMAEYMAIVIAMGRNKTYDKGLIKEIKAFVRRGLFGYLLASYVPVTMKASALSLTLSYRLLIAMYRIAKR